MYDAKSRAGFSICNLLVKWNRKDQILSMFEDKLEFKMRGGEKLCNEILDDALFNFEQEDLLEFYKRCSKMVKIEFLERTFLETSQNLFAKQKLKIGFKTVLETLRERDEISPLESFFLDNCKVDEKEIYRPQ